MANRRRNFAHQESRKLVNTYQFIAFEDLDIQEMQVNGNRTMALSPPEGPRLWARKAMAKPAQSAISRGIADVAWGQFVQFTTYKAANAGRTVMFVNPRGTTQMCSSCGSLVLKDLSVRIHECPDCGLKMCRDVNAALNILARGLASINPDSSRVVEAHVL